jgi:hypothetical protein
MRQVGPPIVAASLGLLAAPALTSAGMPRGPLVPIPRAAFAGSTVKLSGIADKPGGAWSVELQERHGRRWRTVGGTRAKGRLPFSLHWRTPGGVGQATLRVALLKGSRIVAVTAATRVAVRPRPLVIPPTDVASLPAPGQPGQVALHARLPSHGAKGADVKCPTLAAPPQVGQVLAIGYSASTPDGSLTKISLVTVRPPCTINLKTVPATLEEAVGSNGGNLDLATFTEVGQASSSRAARMAGVSAKTFSPGLSKAVSCSSGAAANLTGSASIGVTPSMHAHFSIFGGLTSAEFALTGTASASLAVELHASSGCDLKNTPLLAHALRIATFSGTIGPIPVVVTLLGQLYVDANLSASADTTSNVDAHAFVTGGVRYSKGTFSPVLIGPTTSFTFRPPTITADAHASAHIEPALQALLYGVAGPQLSVTTGLDFTASTAATPWWTLDAPFNLNASLTAPVLDVKSGNLVLYRNTFHVANAPGDFGGGTAFVSVTNPGDQSGTTGTAVNLPIHASDTDGGTLTYAATDLPTGLSIDETTGLVTGTPTAAGTSTVTVRASDASGPSGRTTFKWSLSSPGAWTIKSTPNPNPKTSGLRGVSCVSTNACTAVGSSDGLEAPEPAELTLVEVWDGTAWTVQSSPNRSSGELSTNALNAISCTSSVACTAVGFSREDNGTEVTLAEAWNGTSWTIQNTPNPVGATYSRLQGVSCSSASACTAVGFSSAGVLAEIWNGSAWTLQNTPNPGGSSELAAVSCTSGMACMAVGSSVGETLAERWDGSNWTMQTTPNPRGDDILLGVSCSSDTACTAIGQSLGSVGLTPLAQRWDGTKWTVQTTPNPTGGFFAVSCASATTCVATGATTPTDALLAEGWDGGNWTAQATPTPSASHGSQLYGVSCATPTACTAVGEYQSSAGNTTLAELYSTSP